MKKSKIFFSILGLLMASVGFTSVKSANKVNEFATAAASHGQILLNSNGNVGNPRYRSESSNPSNNCYTYDSLLDAPYAKLSDGSYQIGSSNFKVSGAGGATLTFEEINSSKKCEAIAVPLTFYLGSLSPHTVFKGKITVKINVLGGTSDSRATAAYYNCGMEVSGTQAHLVKASNVPLPSGSTTPAGFSAICGTNSYESNSATTNEIYIEVENTSDSTEHMRALYGWFLLGVRAGSTNHCIKGTINATIKSIASEYQNTVSTSANEYYAGVNTALNSCPDGGTVKLLDDQISSSIITLSGNKSVTLDLNGYNLSFTGTNSYLSIESGNSMKITGSGTISYNYSNSNILNGVILNEGTTTIESAVTIASTSTSSYGAPAVYNKGTLISKGTLSSSGYAIYNTLSGVVKISGGNVTSSLNAAIYTKSCNNDAEIYIYGTPTVSGKDNKDIIMSNGLVPLYGCSFTSGSKGTFYTGSTIGVVITNIPTIDTTIVYQASNASYFSVSCSASNFDSTHFGFTYVPTRRIAYNPIVTYTLTYYPGCSDSTGSTTDSNGYYYNQTATVASCGFIRRYYTFNGWSATQNGSVSRLPGDSVTMTSNVVLYAHWTQNAENLCDYLNDVKLMMTSYDTSLDNTQGDNTCLTSYADAKKYYNGLTTEAKNLFATNDSYNDARERFQAWARANGEYIDFKNKTITQLNSHVISPFGNNGAVEIEDEDQTALILIAGVNLLAFGGLFLFKKKAHR